MTASTPWDDRQERAAQEAAELEQHGYTVTDRIHLGGDVWKLCVIAPAGKAGAAAIQLDVILPDQYPFMPPYVYSADVSLVHHQNPFNGHLCLLERSTENWNPDWHIFRLLDNQLGKAIAAGAELLTEIEESPQGEPFSSYYQYARPTGVIIDAATMPLKVGASGKFDASLVVVPEKQPRLVGVVNRIYVGGHVCEAPGELNRVFAPYEPGHIKGRWTILGEPPSINNAKGLWGLAEQIDSKATNTQKLSKGQPIEVRLIGFPEEHAYRATGVGWICVARHPGQPPGNRSERRVRGKSARSKPEDTYHTIPVYRGSRDDLVHRAPETRGLADKAILVVGCGAIGSVIAEHFARTGVGALHLLDWDYVEPGNLARHAASFQMAGLGKAQSVADRALQVNPYVQVHAHDMMIGSPEPSEDKVSQTSYLAELIRSVDLVVDATAEVGVMDYTSALARSLKTDWICAYGTPGISGGLVAKVGAVSGACFNCLRWHQHKGTLPLPVSTDAEQVQPAGCSAPTFVGTGFDLAVISLQAVRVAVGALLRGTPGAYPEDGHDVYVLDLRDEHGNPHPPAWRGYDLQRHDECPYH